MNGPAFFSPSLFVFLRELKAHNDRAWFEANRERYESTVKAPLQAFVLALDQPLGELCPSYGADPRSSLFRIHRDTRFSKDKSPYKTNVGAQFRHRDCPKDVHAPGFYLHLEPDGCFAACGVWHPDPGTLGRIRQRIATDVRGWKAVGVAGIEVQGERLKRVPAGFPADHPWAEDLKLKDVYTSESFTESQVCAPGFLDQYLDACRRGLPLMRFLVKAVELPW